jgi:hemolysin III
LFIYGVSMVVLYLASGVFHGMFYTSPEERRLFQKIDQSAIFFLIAGTNTPLLLFLLGGAWSRWFLRLMWGLAFVGVGCLWLLPKAPHTVVVAVYLGMGWLGILPFVAYYRAVGWRAMNWMWAGAAFYTFGAVCELAKWPQLWGGPLFVGPHEILHLADTLGTVAFFLFAVRYVIGYQKPVAEDDDPDDVEPEPKLAA